MKNEKGITLVELLASLAIVGIIIVLIASVLSNGTNSSKRTETKQRLQQEANYIVEVIRKDYLKYENTIIELKVVGTGKEQKLESATEIISEGYNYRLLTPSTGIIDPNFDVDFKLELSAQGIEPFVIETKFSKLR